MNTYPNIYLDEAGNTGSDILNRDQPYFLLSAVCFTDEELEQIHKDCNYDKELHFVEMKKSIRGRTIIKKILEHKLIDEKHISFDFVDKRFCIYAQIVDVMIEPVFHFMFHEDLYRKRGNIILANCLYTFCLSHSNKNAVSDFLYSFEGMMRSPTSQNIEKFYSDVNTLRVMSNESLRGILDIITLSHKILEYVLIPDNKYCLDLTVSSLLRLVDHWHKQLESKINIVTDDSKPIKAGMNIIERLSKLGVPEQLVGYDTRKHLYPLPINSISMVNSKKNYGVQLADIISSSFSFIWNDTTTKYKIFQDELKNMRFSQLKGLSIIPATYDFLSQPVDDSNDNNPIDFLMRNLHE